MKPGGLISVMTLNRYSESYRTALQQRGFASAAAQREATSRFAQTFNVSARQYAAEEILPPLQAAGCALVGHYGVRCMCDYIADDDLKADPARFAQLEQLELAMSDRYPYYLLARFFQLIALK